MNYYINLALINSKNKVLKPTGLQKHIGFQQHTGFKNLPQSNIKTDDTYETI